jgi:hypothetical protein
MKTVLSISQSLSSAYKVAPLVTNLFKYSKGSGVALGRGVFVGISVGFSVWVATGVEGTSAAEEVLFA